MTQRLPLLMELGASKAGLQIGYAVMRLDYTVYSPFTVDGVIETDTPGTYVVLDGYAAPDEGGYVAVYESDGGDPPVLTPIARGTIPSAISVADALLVRDWTQMAGPVPGRSALQALRFLRNRWWVDSAGVLTVTAEDDDATAWVANLTSDEDASPVTGLVPTGVP